MKVTVTNTHKRGALQSLSKFNYKVYDSFLSAQVCSTQSIIPQHDFAPRRNVPGFARNAFRVQFKLILLRNYKLIKKQFTSNFYYISGL